MQLLCNGVLLDLYDNAGLQFTHSNPLFAFDDLKCERTTNFKLPATPTNDRVFSLAKIPAYSGEGMRRKFTCQLQAGTVVRDGYLYVANFDGKDYNAVFVTGELVGLQRIKELGTLRYLMPNTSTPQWLTTPKNANADGISNIDTVKYHVQGEDVVNPCVRLFDILNEVLTREQIAFDLSNVTKRDLMYIRGGKITVENINDSLVNDPSGSQDPINLRHILGLTQKINSIIGLGECTAYNDDGQRLSWRSSQDIQYQQYQQLSFPWDAVLEFGKDCPDNLYLITGDMFAMYRSGDGYYYFAPKPIKFLGDYSFEISGFGIETAGVPLAGRKVSIPANMPFALITANGLKLPKPTAIGETAIVGFDAYTVPAYDFEVFVSLDHDFVPGENVPLKACVPDVSIISALKLFAAQEGLVLNYSDGKIILEKNIIPERSEEVRSLTKIGEVVRTFGNYAQRNIVEFDSDIPDYMKIRTEYDIINDNIEQQKELERIVFSEGEQKQRAIDDNIYDDFLMPEGADGDFVAYLSTGTNDKYMQRVRMEKNADIQNLCDRSTQIKIEARMPLLQYDAIKPKTGLLVDGSTYLWTVRSWQKDVAKMTLAQFAKAMIVPPVPTLPPEYQKVEWLGAIDGMAGAYIDSGIIPYIGLNFETKFAQTTYPFDSQYVVDCTMFGLDEGSYESGFCMQLYNRRGLGIQFHMGYSALDNHTFTGIIPDSDVFAVYKYEDGNCYINNSLVLTDNKFVPLSQDLSIYIFALNRNGVVSPGIVNNLRFEFLRLYDSNGDVAHFIPCYRKTDKVPGMYDIVRRQFFVNSGSGSFTVGPDVK